MADILVEQVKSIQRNDPVGKSAWVRYCDSSGTQFRDPGRHDASFLSQFLMQYHEGAFKGMAITEEKPRSETFADFFKEGQRCSLSFKQCWLAYRARFNNGENDPARAGKEGLAEFLEFLGSQGLSALNLIDAAIDFIPIKGHGKGKSKGAPDTGEPPMKRLKNDMVDAVAIRRPDGGMNGFSGGAPMMNQPNGGQGFFQPPPPAMVEYNAGYSDPSQTGFNGSSQTGFDGQPQTGFNDPSQMGFSDPSQTGFSPAQTGFSGPSQTGFNPSQTGFSSPQQSGYSPPQDQRQMQNQQPQEGWGYSL